MNVVRQTLQFAAFKELLKAMASWIDRQSWLRAEPLRSGSGGLHAGLVSRDTHADR